MGVRRARPALLRRRGRAVGRSAPTLLSGALLVAGSWFSGPGRRAAALRGAAGPALRDHAAAVRVGVGALLLLLVLWGPVPWTQRVVPMLVLAIAVFAWVEWLRADARVAQ